MKTRIRTFAEYTEKLHMAKTLNKDNNRKTVFNVLMSELTEYYNTKI